MPLPFNVPRGSYGPMGHTPAVAPLAGVAGAPPVIPKLYWNAYSDEQRIKKLWQCFNLMADRVNQLGYYYIPDFKGEWDRTKEYPPLSVVEAPEGVEGVTAGDSYTARDWVPVGTPLTDETHWARTGNYNAQVASVEQGLNALIPEVDRANETADMALSTSQTNAESIASINKKTVYYLTDYKTESDADYTNAWAKIMSLIGDNEGGTIKTGTGDFVTGNFSVTKKNVSIMGGCYGSTITIDVPNSTNQDASHVTIQGVSFIGSEPFIHFNQSSGVMVTNCNAKCSAACITATTNPSYNQQNRQIEITNCRFYGEESLYVNSPRSTSNTNYAMSDVTIANCQMLNTVYNVYGIGIDGLVLNSNTMFLSLGGSNKMDNVYLDHVSMCVVTGNEMFEAGRCGVYHRIGTSFLISNNNIIWNGQYVQDFGIRVDGANSYAGESYIAEGVITGNHIVRPSAGAVYIDKDVCIVSNNVTTYTYSSEHWKGGSNLPNSSGYAFESGDNVHNIVSTGNCGFNLSLGYSYEFVDANGYYQNDMSYDTNGKFPITNMRSSAMNFVSVTNNTNVNHNSLPTFLMFNNVTSITVQNIIGNWTTNYPKFGVARFYTNTTIESKSFTAGQTVGFVIYGNTVNWMD